MKGAIDNLPIIQKTLEDLGSANTTSTVTPPLVARSCSSSIRPNLLASITALTASPSTAHKMIGSLVPCGAMLAKRENVTDIQAPGGCVEYMGILDTTLTGSRSSFAPLLL
jgi:histidine decarboxylase